MDLSISCCRVIFAVFFFFAGWSFWVVAGAVAAGAVVAGADVVAAGADVVAAGAEVVAAGAGVVAAGAGVVAASGAGAGAVVVSDPAPGAFWAIRRPAGTHTATAAAATIRESFCI
jgi:DNA-binding transcriptional LysR family regulator